MHVTSPFRSDPPVRPRLLPSGRPIRPAFLAALALAAVLPCAGAGAGDLIYGLTEKGRLSVNGTVLDSLRSSFDADSQTNPQQRWVELVVDGSDRYALRRDGLIYRNGRRLDDLPFSPSVAFNWISLAVGPGGVYALRQDGLVAVVASGGSRGFTLPVGDGTGNLFAFRQLVVNGDDLWTLRADGAIFRGEDTTPAFRFSAGEGLFQAGDGLAPDTVWNALAVDPLTGELLALRVDGNVYRGDPSALGGDEPVSGEAAIALPFPSARLPLAGEFYLDLTFLDDGSWRLLRADGAIFAEGAGQGPVVDHPGLGDSENTIFVDIAALGGDFWAVRRDGRVFKNLVTTPAIVLPKKPYTRIALGVEPPDLSRFKNQRPVVAVYKITTFPGESVTVPVIATDGDRRSSDLAVTALDPLPPGAVWDAERRVLTWAAAGPVGSYRFAVTVSDGVARPKRFTYSIKVRPADTRPEKNKPPIPVKVKTAQALVGREISLPLFAFDPDGDDVSISADETRYPFTAGAEFDADTGVFTWTPGFDDIGKATVRFAVTDGMRRKKLKVKLLVIDPLIF